MLSKFTAQHAVQRHAELSVEAVSLLVLAKSQQRHVDIISIMIVRKSISFGVKREHVPERKDEQGVAEGPQRHKVLSSIKGSIKSAVQKTQSPKGSKYPVTTHISRPHVDPQQRIDIMRGRGPLLELGDIGSQILNIPADPWESREKITLEQLFKSPAQRKTAYIPTIVSYDGCTGTAEQTSSSQALERNVPSSRFLSAQAAGPPHPDSEFPLRKPPQNGFIALHFPEGYTLNGDGSVRGYRTKRTGWNFLTADDSNYSNTAISFDNQSNGKLDCEIRRQAGDLRQVCSPPSEQMNVVDGSNLPSRMTRFDDLIAFGKGCANEKADTLLDTKKGP
jgi:hypothetical protein